MCGIACIVGTHETEKLGRLVKELIEPIPHRGPDGQGIYVDSNVALGHRRLAIIELTDHGAQPMHSGDGHLVLSFNGEIYNYIELRNELVALGFVFRTQSDTEVILAAYSAWGEDCVKRFNGMWAFVIHDRRRGILFGSRDRFGVKPLYYTKVGDGFAFASEIRQLLPVLPQVRANVGLVAEFLLTSFSDYSNETYFEGIFKIPAGHNFIVDTASIQLEITRHYRLAIRTDLQSLSPEEAAAEYGTMLTDAVRLRMRSDVKVGTCLSGGLDSSSVAAIASRIYAESTTEPFSAITAVSEQASNDETIYARQVVDRFGLRWLPVRPQYDDFVDTLPDVVRAQEEPYASPSINMQYFVMREARKNRVTVLLDGQGGDETLLGYEKYYAAYYASLVRRYGFLAALKGYRQVNKNNANMNLARTMKFLVGGLWAKPRFQFYKYSQRHIRYSRGVPWFITALAREAINDFGLQRLEIECTNLPVLLRYEDKNSMAHSIETRLPFLDYRAVETALSLPIEFKLRNGWTKWILREAMKSVLPESIAWRKNKMGFEAPEKIWLPKHDKHMWNQISGSAILAALTHPGRLRSAYPSLNVRSKWRLYSVAMWEQAFGVGI